MAGAIKNTGIVTIKVISRGRGSPVALSIKTFTVAEMIRAIAQIKNFIC